MMQVLNVQETHKVSGGFKLSKKDVKGITIVNEYVDFLKKQNFSAEKINILKRYSAEKQGLSLYYFPQDSINA